MNGLDCLGAVCIGADGADIAKIFGGLMSGAGGLLSGTQNREAAITAIDRIRLEEERRRAEESAKAMKTALIIGGGLAAATLGVILLKRKS